MEPLLVLGQFAQEVKHRLPVEGVQIRGCGIVGADGLEDGEGFGEELVCCVEGFEVEEVAWVVVRGGDEEVVGEEGLVIVLKLAGFELERRSCVELEGVRVGGY